MAASSMQACRKVRSAMSIRRTLPEIGFVNLLATKIVLVRVP